MANLKSKTPQDLGAPSGSASGADPARGQSNADPLPVRSSGEQQPQQVAPTPPIPARGEDFVGMHRGSPSPSPGIQRRNITMDLASQSLVVLASMRSQPHSSCSGTTAVQTQETPHDLSKVSSHDPCSSSPSDVQGPSSIPAIVPSLPPSLPPISNENPTCPSTAAPPLGTNLEKSQGM